MSSAIESPERHHGKSKKSAEHRTKPKSPTLFGPTRRLMVTAVRPHDGRTVTMGGDAVMLMQLAATAYVRMVTKSVIDAHGAMTLRNYEMLRNQRSVEWKHRNNFPFQVKKAKKTKKNDKVAK
jgi:hypothetical protein